MGPPKKMPPKEALPLAVIPRVRLRRDSIRKKQVEVATGGHQRRHPESGLITHTAHTTGSQRSRLFRPCHLCPGTSTPEVYTFQDLYFHYETMHQLCICAYCDFSVPLQLQTELYSHLQQVHKLPEQVFPDIQEFYDKNGKWSTLECSDCGQRFSTNLEVAARLEHQCTVKFRSCRLCKAPWPTEKVLDHESLCEGRQQATVTTPARRQLPPTAVPIQISPLRPRIGRCKKCQKTVPPAKLAEHLKSCDGVQSVPSFDHTRSESTQAVNRSRRLVKVITAMPLPPPPTPKLPPLRLRLPLLKPQPDPQLIPVEPEPIRVPEAVVVLNRLDPLLLEPDSNKRLNMLILLLVDYIHIENDKHHSQRVDHGQIFTVTIPDEWREEHVDWLLQKLLMKSSEYCLYCRQAILIRVDKRQLLLHLLINHRFQIQEIKTVASQTQQSYSKTDLKKSEPNSPLEPLEEPEVETEIKELVDHIVGIVSGEIECENRDANNNPVPISATSVPPLPVLAISTTTTVTVVNWNEFQLFLLEAVFQAPETNVLFCYDRGDIEFGQLPCECLLCGRRIKDQLQLFSHWKRVHAAMAMSCAMCAGQFVYSGSLFSHHCFGTSKPFEDASLALGTFGAENLTVLLRYQCEFCDIQLPGFFNYMVHIRKVHITCELCLDTCQSQANLENHHRSHKLHHFCWKCEIGYAEKSNFWTHLYWKHGTESKTCHRCLEKKWPFLYHFCLPPPIFTCETCKLQFTKAVCLLVHKRLHTNDKLRKCPVSPSCPKEFISMKLLKKHIEMNHMKKEEAKPILWTNEPESDLQLEPIINCVNPSFQELRPVFSFEDELGEPTDIVLEQLDKSEDEIQQLLAEIVESIAQGESNNGDDHQFDNKILEKFLKPEEIVEKLTESQSNRGDQSAKTDNSDNTIPEKSLQSEEIEELLDEIITKVVDDQCAGRDKSPEKFPQMPEDSKAWAHAPTTPKFGLNLSEDESDGDDDGDKVAATACIAAATPGQEEDVVTETEDEPRSIKTSAIIKSEMAVGDDFIVGEKDFAAEEIDWLLPPIETELLDISILAEENCVSDEQHILNCASLDHSYSSHSTEPEEAETIRTQVTPPPMAGTLSRNFSVASPLPCNEAKFATQNTQKAMKIQTSSRVAMASTKAKHKREQENLKRRHLSSSSSSSSCSTCSSSSCGSNCSCSGSSSSSSSSSSSGSSCGSNCSCSSKSSSESEHESKPRPQPQPRYQVVKTGNFNQSGKLVLKKWNRNSSTPKKPKVKPQTFDTPKRGRGRPRKIGSPGSSSPSPKKTPRKPKCTQGIQLKNLKPVPPKLSKKHELHIPESDLETDLSDSEDTFNKQQMECMTGKVPFAFNEVWERSNESFLLQIVKGVKSLEELRPTPNLPKPNRSTTLITEGMALVKRRARRARKRRR